MIARKLPSPLLLNKVPEVTIYFWLIKILATTVGETAADLLAIRLDLGLAATSLVMAVALAPVIVWQISGDRYRAPVYWLTVVLISVVGTLVTDGLVDGLGVSLEATAIAFAILLVGTFSAWYARERTLSIHTIVTRRREMFYWAAILVTFAMGTAIGDLIAERLDLGYAQAALVFGSTIALITLVYYLTNVSPILCFWLAYIVTRPLGASIGDWLAKPEMADGLGFGTLTTSTAFLIAILVLVGFLTLTKVDNIAAD